MPDMIKVFQPESEAELAVIQSVLSAENIKHFVSNSRKHGKGLNPRNQNFPKCILVNPKDADMAREIIAAYGAENAIPDTEWEGNPPEAGSFFQKLRTIIQKLLPGG